MRGWRRREVLSAAWMIGLATPAVRAAGSRRVWLVSDPSDAVAQAASSRWAFDQLEQALRGRGIDTARAARPSSSGDAALTLVAADAGASLPRRARIAVPDAPESCGVGSFAGAGGPMTVAAGRDARGLSYALLDLADIAAQAPDPVAALSALEPNGAQPLNRVRSITRMFCSEVEDIGWYHDRDMWRAYLTMLAGERFNRFNLAFGIGYDFLQQVTDAYFLFTYPFLVDVPGYDVRVPPLAPAERERNLATLRFIGEETVARGLDFHLGLWMHGYKWLNTTAPTYVVEGIDASNHGPYCRDALRTLLQSVPTIGGVTIRIHGESGVEEGSYDFWRTVFQGVASCGRPVSLDMHPKGMSQEMLDIALATKQQVTVSPKYWGEHMGLPYHQADIRTLERPKPGEEKTGLMKLSTGTRSFLRYGYGDLLREDRPWGIVHRVWPGTQRVLVWADPDAAAAHARAFTFCGSDGGEVMEPLAFKGRRGSGHPVSRCGYADASLDPRWDWQKYALTFRVWGRALYDPAGMTAPWRRALDARFGPAGAALGTALSRAGRILPTITTAHAPSAGNNTYWPELYYNQSFVDAEHFGPYDDSIAPKVFGNVSPFDPQLFLGINEHAAELLSADRSERYTPIEVAQWLEDDAAAAATALARAVSVARDRGDPEWRRLAIDIPILIGIGRFFGAKLRSGVLYGIFDRTGDDAALTQSVAFYRQARDGWAQAAATARNVYTVDLTLGELPQLRGHWLDRLPAMDRDIALVEEQRKRTKPQGAGAASAAAIAASIGRPPVRVAQLRHAPPARFSRGRAIPLSVLSAEPLEGVVLRYRHVNHAERYEEIAMRREGSAFRIEIPADYTRTAYPMQYYFVARRSASSAALYPGLGPERTDQPYFVVRQA